MSHPSTRPLTGVLATRLLATGLLATGLLATGLLAAGCSSDPDPMVTSGPDASASASAPASPYPSASVSPSPSSTLTAEEQQAFEEATEVVRRYEQMFYDILSDPEPRLNDLNEVATQPQLDLDLRNLQSLVSGGGFVIQSGGPTVVITAKPVTVNLSVDPARVILEACIDQTAASGTQDGTPWTGPREIANYRVVKTVYLPAPGWAVAKVLPPVGTDQPQPC